MYRLIVVLAALLLFASPAGATYQFFPANACTGGGDALDGIDCDGGAGPPSWEACADGDAGFVVTSGQAVCIYVMDDDAACGGDSTESPCPASVQPDDRSDAAANQCWVLVSVYGNTFGALPSATPTNAYYDSDATAGDVNCRTYVNCTDAGDGSEDCDWTLECQVAGTPTNKIVADADGNVTITSLAATSPTFVTPVLGTITSGVGTALTALDGENIQNDTIDDDSIDFADVTCADVTMSDCGAITSSGTINGLIQSTEDADGNATLAAGDCDGQIIYNNTQPNVYILPAAAAGLNICFYEDSAHAITIRPLAAGDDHIWYNGTDCGEDDDLVGPGTVGSFICLHAKDAADWMSLGFANTWTCE